MTTGRKIAKISLRVSLFCVIVWAAFGFVFVITYGIIEHRKTSEGPIRLDSIPDSYDLSDLDGKLIDFQPVESEKKWMNDETILAIAFFSVAAFVIFIVSFGLTYLGGHIVNGNIGATRLGIVISMLLILGLNPFVLSLNDPDFWISYEGLAVFLGILVMPMIAYWGLLWIIKGFLRKGTL